MGVFLVGPPTFKKGIIMYTLTWGLVKTGRYKTFEAAFIDLYDRLKAALDDEDVGMSYQMLETAIWIEADVLQLPIMFYDARDIACTSGLLVDGEIPQSKRDEFQETNQIIEQEEKDHSIDGCPNCRSDLIEKIEPFDHVNECKSCGFQFLGV